VPLFKKTVPTPEVETTGTDVIRSTLAAHAKGSLNLAVIARDLGVSAERLRDFLEHRASLEPAVLQALVKRLYHGHTEIDLDLDRLKPVNREPAKSLPVGTPPWSGGSNVPELNGRTPGVIYAPRYPRLPGAEDKPALPARSPGWA
jgi:hypothetical protein